MKTGCTIYQLVTRGKRTYAATSLRRLVCIDHSREPFETSEISGFTDSVFSVALSEKNGLLIAGGQDGTIRGWDCDGSEPKFVLRGHFSDVRSIAFMDNVVVSGAVDGQINLWAPWSATLLRSFNVCGAQIWSLAVIGLSSVAVLCDHGHLHIMDLLDGSESGRYALPPGHGRFLIRDDVLESVIVGGEGFIWSLNTRDWTHMRIPVPHPSVRAIVKAGNDEFLMGGAYGMIVLATGRFTQFRCIRDVGNDYVSSFTMLDENRVLAGDAAGRLFVLERISFSWLETATLTVLSHRPELFAEKADFRYAKNVSIERMTRLALAGALTT